jgi:pilus assembly protein Flp/PilA
MLNKIKGLFLEEEGQGMAEYALLLAGIAVVVMVAVYALGPVIKNKFSSVSNQLGS